MYLQTLTPMTSVPKEVELLARENFYDWIKFYKFRIWMKLISQATSWFITARPTPFLLLSTN
jgi:hypothetical protein